MFSLLEHADESGAVQGTSAASTANRSNQAQGNKGQQQAAKAQAKKAQAAKQPAASNQSNQSGARAEDYYRAFEHVYKDQSSGWWVGQAALIRCPGVLWVQLLRSAGNMSQADS
jgi:hypothetical protein